MTIQMRAASAADVPALSRLGIDSFVAKFGHLYRPEDLATFLRQAYSPETVAAELASPERIYRLAEAGGALAGYCKLALPCGFPEHARGARCIELKQLYTDPARTGEGIGASLMDWAMAEAARLGCDEMQLSVWSGNAGAQRFYARRGFTRIADVTFAVGEHVDHEFLFARML
jgi:GNAT superfamily N-acetyltransferase